MKVFNHLNDYFISFNFNIYDDLCNHNDFVVRKNL